MMHFGMEAESNLVPADIRMRCAIHSQTSGTIMVIPRERNLVRLYIQLASLSPALGERFDRTTVTPQTIFQAAQKILQPYEISYDYCEWWTVYQVGSYWVRLSLDLH